MEKVIAVLRRADSNDEWCARQRGPVADALLDLGLPGLAVNVRDDAVRNSLMTMTVLDPPVAAVVSMWTQQCYGAQTTAALKLLAAECEQLDAYLVTESTPLPGPDVEPGRRTIGFANVVLLRRPAEMEEAFWLDRWQLHQTSVAIETQSTFGYTQNWVVRALTPDAAGISGIVEELFPAEAIADLHAFFGAADDDDLKDRLGRMVASTTAFGANENIDSAATSRYVFRTPFHT
ncbi:hypothetical protein [Mycobacterium montefiorense]|uniref:hypothetical protein n=1 Tax=Mycobacterium montefiorense TaxID=154654 RepID=UPI0021DEE930|nr:hypothetical protein [Mycobacterium montefiorense]MCV7425748.1 hypothetical protein [Mycobacterium montefiorense]GLE52575.1 hypothetical protein ATCCBAA256_21390 [Mycobacterium montefiorense]